ncbi:GntR family transcriptional regulator [Limimaricola cinnabarinus]|uniref:Transcriptional regulator, GntR family n=1 Tax=Limimaricola cinnabarinus LL-001 TaxID=1337093 RepID=U2Z7W3_9RHOB|nr:GntR family transcriptional regulator [Limimaricola cinnabarinus]GAD57545.1 transcriptional regulator, GntR family [Limimaricola cinnabarinus LL-001]
MTRTSRIEPTSAEMIADGLSRAIHEHRLGPGAKLGEDEIGTIYGVSRTVVRAALQTLSHQRLVTIRRNRGAFVASPSPREAREVFEARALLEPRTAQSAAERAEPQDIDQLRAHIMAEHAAIEAGDNGRALHLSGRFHIDLARIADQTIVAGFVEELVARSSLVIALYWRRQSALCERHAHHALIEAVAAGQGARAAELMHSHLVDLHSALDLREHSVPPATLRDILT